MSLADLKIFEGWSYTTMIELLTQQLGLFNEASGGAIRLISGDTQGNLHDDAFWGEISGGIVRRRDPYAATAVATKQLNQSSIKRVKVASGTAPVDISPHFLQWIKRDPQEAGMVYGEMLAKERLADMVNTSLLILVTALTNHADVTLDASAAGTTTLARLNSASAKFGDASQVIKTWVCHSKALHDIRGEAIANADRLFEFGTIQVTTDGFGRRFVVTDSPALFNVTPDPDQYTTLGLRANAIVVRDEGDFLQNVETSNGTENITRTVQSQWSNSYAPMAFTWDEVAGGVAPDDAALGAAANWDRVHTDLKLLPGVALITQ